MISVEQLSKVGEGEVIKKKEYRDALFYWGDKLLGYTVSRGCPNKMKVAYRGLAAFATTNLNDFYMSKYKLKDSKVIRDRSSGVVYTRANITDDDALRLVKEEPSRARLFDLDAKGLKSFEQASQAYEGSDESELEKLREQLAAADLRTAEGKKLKEELEPKIKELESK